MQAEALNEHPEVAPLPTLVLCWGNPSRGDDALGPSFADALSAKQLPGTEIMQDYQLQIEYCLDLHRRARILFVDAGISGKAPYTLHQLQAERDNSYSSHSLSPQALLAVYEQTRGQAAPPSFLLTIRGYEFELGQALSTSARSNLDEALGFAQGFLQD